MRDRFSQLVRRFFRSRQFERDLAEEIETSFKMMVERLVARGMTPAAARRAARADFEGIELGIHDRFPSSPFHAILQDFRYAWRGLRRQPAFTWMTLPMLALGIGISAAVFSVFYAVLLRPLPYQQPERLALIWTYFRGAGTARAPVSPVILNEVRHRNRTLAGVAGIWTITRTFTGDEPEQVKAARVTPDFFDLLGVHASYGRTFQKEDAGGPSIILANGFFKRRFGGDGALLGKRLAMDRANNLVGVLPPEFQLHFAPDSNVPLDVQVFDTFGNGIFQDRANYYIRLVTRLKPGVSMNEAQRDLNRVAGEIRGAYTEYADENIRFTIQRMQADAVRDVKPALAALLAGSTFLLLICCVNVASLFVARAADRRKEIALRLSIGASRGRILRQLLVEGALLCALGGIAGIVIGWGGYRGLLAIRPERLAGIESAGFSWPVAAFAAACSLGAALLFGIAPALETSRIDLMAALRAKSGGWLSRFHRTAGRALIVGEIMLGFVLVAGAALSVRTLSNVEDVRPGFEPQQLLAFQVSNGIPPNQVADWETELGAMPGVETVGATSHLPLDNDIPNWYAAYRPEGSAANGSSALISDLRCVTPGYLAAMGARLIEGRYFDKADSAGAAPVIIVDRSVAQASWPHQSAIGRRIAAEHVTRNGFQPISSTVVGVVEHVHNHSLTKEVRGQIYMPFEQSPRAPLTYVLRTRVPPLSLAPAIREKLHEHSKNAAMAKVRGMTEYVAREISPLSFTAILAAIFGATSLLLAAAGVYGVLNYQVLQRRSEMGIRMALGASAHDILRLVIREGLVLAAVGMALGCACASLVARGLATLLYGVGPLDPMSYSIAVALFAGAALVGCWRPAWRASAASPSEVIRAE